MDMDLFDYPCTPGYKARDTAKAAAEVMRPKAHKWRERVLHAITDTEGLTCDEIALMLGASVLTVRPRVTELARMEKLVDSGRRRPGISGARMIVWKTA